MSWKATAWAKETRGHRSTGQKLVLMILADYAQPKTNIAWPDEKLIAEDAGTSLRSVQRHLAALITDGYITVTHHGNQYQRKEYVVAPAILAAAEPSAPATHVAVLPPPVSRSYRKEPSVEPSVPSPSGKGGKKKYLPVDKDFIEDRVKAFADLLGGEAAVRDHIEAALNHTALNTAINKRLYVKRWLKRQVKWREEGHENGRAQGHSGAGRRAPVGRAGRPAGDGEGW